MQTLPAGPALVDASSAARPPRETHALYGFLVTSARACGRPPRSNEYEIGIQLQKRVKGRSG